MSLFNTAIEIVKKKTINSGKKKKGYF